MQMEGVYGARMTGGGFGGCTVNLVRPEAAAEIKTKIKAAYEKQFSKTPQIYECVPSDGASPIN